MSSIALESRLLLEAAAVAAPVTGVTVPEDCGSLSWDRLLGQAIHQRCAPLLCRRLAGDGAPASAARALDRLYLQCLLRSEGIRAQLAELAPVFADAGIPLMALKGVYLARSVYADPALRPMADIDLMVPREAVTALPELLAPLGYRLSGVARRSRWDEWWVDGELCTFVADGRRPLEFHAALGSRIWPRPAAVWQRARSWDAGEATLQAPDPTHLLIHLIKHLVHHLDAPRPIYLIWLADIARVLAHHEREIDAAELRDAFRRLKLDAHASLILQFCQAHLGAPDLSAVASGKWQVASGDDRRAPGDTPAPHSDGPIPAQRLSLSWLVGLATADASEAEALQMERTAAAASRWRRRSLPANAAYAAGLLFPDPQYVRRHFPEAGPTDALWRYGAHLLAKAGRHVQFWGARQRKEHHGGVASGKWQVASGDDHPRPIGAQRLRLDTPYAQLKLPQADPKSAALAALIASGQRARLPAVGSSMLPTIRPGDTLVVGPASPETLALGDVIVWLADERLIAHRVVRLWEDAGVRLFQTHGDARRHPDPVAVVSRVIGRVEDVERPQPVPARRRFAGLVPLRSRPG